MSDADRPPNAATKEPWHLQKGVPIAVIFAIVLQTVGGVWFGATTVASMEHTLADHQRRIGALELADSRMADETKRVGEALARLDERLAAQTRILERLENAMTRQSGRQ